MTTIAMVPLTQGGATLLAAITMAATLAATASVAATSPDSSDGRRCFHATTAAGAGEAILAAVASNRPQKITFGARNRRARGPDLLLGLQVQPLHRD